MTPIEKLGDAINRAIVYPTITGVAIHQHDGIIHSLPKPNRHHDVLGMIIGGVDGNHVEGFVLDNGKFIDRLDAMLIARCNGQLKHAATKQIALTPTTPTLKGIFCSKKTPNEGGSLRLQAKHRRTMTLMFAYKRPPEELKRFGTASSKQTNLPVKTECGHAPSLADYRRFLQSDSVIHHGKHPKSTKTCIMASRSHHCIQSRRST